METIYGQHFFNKIVTETVVQVALTYRATHKQFIIPLNELPYCMESLFDGNYNETWNATLNQFDAFVANLSFYLSCFESDKFVGKHISRPYVFPCPMSIPKSRVLSNIEISVFLLRPVRFKYFLKFCKHSEAQYRLHILVCTMPSPICNRSHS